MHRYSSETSRDVLDSKCFINTSRDEALAARLLDELPNGLAASE
jgi:hypothetical protein